MKTGHLEIMSTLVALCQPCPKGCVPFDPVRDNIIDLYGAAVDHPDFVHAFRLVIDAGGAGSVHMQDLENFTSVYVNPKLRKMRMEAYAIVAPYPVEFPNIEKTPALHGVVNKPQTKYGASCLPASRAESPHTRKWGRTTS